MDTLRDRDAAERLAQSRTSHRGSDVSRPAPGALLGGAPGPPHRPHRVQGHAGSPPGCRQLGAEVMGISLPRARRHRRRCGRRWACSVPRREPTTSPSRAGSSEVTGLRPEVVLHLAAQPLVPVGYRDPLRTFDVNVQGTARVLALLPALTVARGDARRHHRQGVRPRQRRHAARRGPLGGHDPYSASKAADRAGRGVVAVHGLPVATARAGNVIGGGDSRPTGCCPDLVRAGRPARPVELRAPARSGPGSTCSSRCAATCCYAEALAAGDARASPPRTSARAGQLVECRAGGGARRAVWRAGQRRPDGGWRPANGPQIPENRPARDRLLEHRPTAAAARRRARLAGRRSPWTMEWYARAATAKPRRDLVVEAAGRATTSGSGRVRRHDCGDR